MSRWWLLLGLVACGGDDETHDCDAGTPTCTSTLVVRLPDAREAFTVTVVFGDGTLVVTCPSETGDLVVDPYTATCGQGQFTVTTDTAFPDTFSVQLEEKPPENYTPDYTNGADFCGNPCTSGTVQL